MTVAHRPVPHVVLIDDREWRAFKPHLHTGSVTLAEFVRLELEQLARERTKSVGDFRKAMARLPDDFLSTRLDRLAVSDVAAVVKWLKSRTKSNGRPRYANKTVRTTHALLSALLQRAVGAELIRANPAKGLPRGVLPRNSVRAAFEPGRQVLTVEEAELLLCSSIIPRGRRVLYAFTLFTGLRISEVIGTQWSQWDPHFAPLSRLRVEWQWTARGLDDLKNGEPREVPVHPDLATMLLWWRDGVEGWPGRAAKHRRRPGPSDFLFPSLYQGKLEAKNAGGLRRVFRKDLERLRLGVRTFHALRKSFITLAVNAGANENAIFSLTHRDPSIRAIYRKWNFEKVAAELLKFPVRIDGDRPQLEMFGGNR